MPTDKITMGEPTAQMEEAQRKQLAGEALFIRAYHYFNLVRLFGGVFMLTTNRRTRCIKIHQSLFCRRML